MLKKCNLSVKIKTVMKMRITNKLPVYDREFYIGRGKTFSVSKKTLSEPCRAHAHDFFEMEFIISGSGKHIINGKEHRLNSGSLYILTPSDVHVVIPDEPLDYYGIMFSEEIFREALIGDILISTEGTQIELSRNEAEKMKNLFSLLTEDKKEDTFSDDFSGGLMRCIMVLFFRAMGEINLKVSASGIKTALVYIHRYFKEQIGLKEAAAAANLSGHYFSDLFKKTMGKNFYDYLTSLRLRYAENLLILSSESITEICFASGFNSFPGFFRAFKKKHGISPREFRKNKGKTT